MTKAKTAAAAQPDLLGDKPAETVKPVAAAKTAPKKTQKVVALKQAKPKSQAVALVKPAAPRTMMEVIGNAAMNPNVDANKMRELYAIQKMIAEDEAMAAFNADFIAMQDDLPEIDQHGRIVIEGKPGKKGQNTPYAKYNDIDKAVRPILKRHGFATSFSTEPSADGTRLHVKGILSHVKGHQRTTVFPLPAETSGSKNNVQGWGSSFSFGKRYAVTALLNIISKAPADADDDGAAAGNAATGGGNAEPKEEEAKVSEGQIAKIVKAIDDAGVTALAFNDKFGIQKIADLPVSKYGAAIAALNKHAEGRK